MRGKGFQEEIKQDAPEITQIATKVRKKKRQHRQRQRLKFK